MTHLRKTLSVFVSIAIACCANIVNVSAENIVEETQTDEQSFTEAVEITEELKATDVSYIYSPKTRATISVGDVFDKYGVLSSDDAIDFYPFSLSKSRTAIFRFLSENSDYTANLATHDTSTGNVTLSNVWLNHGDVSWSSKLPAGNYCWVILSSTNTYTSARYRISMNARNESGATEHINTSADLSYSTFSYNGTLYMNGINIEDTARNAAKTISKFEDRMEGPSPTNTVATVTVLTGYEYISDSLFYGSYTSTNPYKNVKTGLYHSTDHAIFIPIVGHSMSCTYSTYYVPTQQLIETAVGILVYDLESGKIIDFMSPINIFYANTYFNYTYTYDTYKEITI